MLDAALALVAAASARAASGIPDNTGDLLREVQVLMSAKAGPVRSAESIQEALVQVHAWLVDVRGDRLRRRLVAPLDQPHVPRPRHPDQRVRVPLRDGRLRRARRPVARVGPLHRPRRRASRTASTELPDVFRFTLDGGALDDEVQETSWVPADGLAARRSRATPDDPAGEPVFRWRPRRPIPEDDDFFENVWREFREHGNIH